MKAAIYGASVSGYYASEILKLSGCNIEFYIDQTGKISDPRNLDKVSVYNTIDEIPRNLLEGIDLIFIALGDEKVSRDLSEKLSTIIDIPIHTIHDKPYVTIYKMLNIKKISYLEECGFYRTLNENNCIDNEGKPIPWITYPCIEFIKDKINSEMTIFEYGSGNSTLWWSNKVKKVISVEHNLEWYQKVRKQLFKSNVNIIHRDLIYGGEYSKEIIKHQNIDVVVIDGRDRVNCAINCVNSLSNEGIIIWDNTDRTSYLKGNDFLLQKGFKRVDFIGLAPMCDFKTQTSIYYKKNNCLGL